MLNDNYYNSLKVVFLPLVVSNDSVASLAAPTCALISVFVFLSKGEVNIKSLSTDLAIGHAVRQID